MFTEKQIYALRYLIENTRGAWSHEIFSSPEEQNILLRLDDAGLVCWVIHFSANKSIGWIITPAGEQALKGNDTIESALKRAREQLEITPLVRWVTKAQLKELVGE